MSDPITEIKRYKKNIPLTYLFEFGRGMGFTQAIWVTYLAFKGLSLVEIGLCESVFHLTSMLMELPTGMIADIYGRKFSRLMGIVANIIYLCLLLFVNGVPLALLAFVFAALSYNLESGADTALIYDSLLVNDETASFTKIQGRREVVLQSAALIGVLIGGILADIDYRIAILAAMVLGLLVFIIGLRFIEVPVQREKMRMKEAFADQFKKPWRMVKAQPELVFHMILVAIVLSSITTAHYYATVFLKNNGFSLSLISLFLIIQSCGAILGGAGANRLKVRFSEETLFRVVPFFITLAILLLPTPFFALSLFLMGFSDSILYVVLTNKINHHIQSDERATILSLNSMFFSIVMIVLFPAFGILADKTGLASAFFVLAAATAILAILNVLKIRFKRSIGV
ncbi:MAG: MFS transporter [Erysipelotrichaceae bacterium]